VSISSRPFFVPTTLMTSIALLSILDQILNFGGLVQGNGFLAFKLLIFPDCLCSSRKTGAPSIQNDTQFVITLQVLLKWDKNKTHVSVEFDVDMMEGFCTKQVVHIFIYSLLTCTHIPQLPPSIVQDGAGGEEELESVRYPLFGLHMDNEYRFDRNQSTPTVAN